MTLAETHNGWLTMGYAGSDRGSSGDKADGFDRAAGFGSNSGSDGQLIVDTHGVMTIIDDRDPLRLFSLFPVPLLTC